VNVQIAKIKVKMKNERSGKIWVKKSFNRINKGKLKT
jgi:hypothetical protein